MQKDNEDFKVFVQFLRGSRVFIRITLRAQCNVPVMEEEDRHATGFPTAGLWHSGH